MNTASSKNRKNPAAFLNTVYGSAGILSFVLLLVLFSVQLSFLKPFYTTPDDIYKVLTTKGIAADSSPSPFIGYSNILLGYLLVKLFAWAPTFPWYGCFLCAVLFLTFWAFLWLLCSRHRGWFYPLFFIGLWTDVFFIFLLLFQFTIISLLAAFAGILGFCLNEEVSGRRHQGGFILLSSLLILAAGVIRMNALEMAILVSSPFLLSRLRDKKFRNYCARRRFVLVPIVLGLLFLGAIDFFWYQSDPHWKEYRRFDAARVELQDYRIVQFTPQTKPYFDSIGWSENDLWLFRSWFYMNPKKYSVENLEKLSHFFPRVGSSGKPVSAHSLQELLSWDWDLRMSLCFFLLLAFCPRTRWKYLLVQWIWILAVFLVLIYFYRAPDRLTMPILGFLIMVSALYVENPLEDKFGKGLSAWLKLLALAAVMLFSSHWLWLYYGQNISRLQSQAQLQEALKDLKADPNKLYEAWSFPFDAFNAFDDLESLRPFHLLIFSFCQTCPSSLRGLDRFGIKEPLKDAVDNPSVLMICSPWEGQHYHQYIKENYGEDIYAKPVFKGNYFKVFKILSKKRVKPSSHPIVQGMD